MVELVLTSQRRSGIRTELYQHLGSPQTLLLPDALRELVTLTLTLDALR